MKAGFFLRQAARDFRGQRWRLIFFVACLAVGVAAVVAVSGLAQSFEKTLRGEARQLLAADLTVEGWRPVSEAIEARVAKVPGVQIAHVAEMVGLAAAPPRDGKPGPSRLVELKVVDGRYPFYGEVKLEPPGRLGDELDAESAVAQPDLLRALSLQVGDKLLVGGAEFVLKSQVVNEPDRMGGAFSLGPRLFLTHEGLERTRLVGRGSRVEHRLLVKMPETTPPRDLAALAAELKALAAGQYRVETYAEGQPQLRQGIRRAESFLGLIALLSLLAGGIGVAQTVRAWIESRVDSIAILKCLGLRPREALWLYLGETAAVGFAGSLAGIALGILVQYLLPSVLGPLAPAGVIHPWQPWAFLRGLLLGTGVALVFSLGPLAGVLAISPARVFRRNAEPLKQPRLLAVGLAVALVAGVFLSALAQARTLVPAAVFTGILAAAVAVLAAAAWGLVRLARRLAESGRFSFSLTQGLSALTRPGAGTLGAVVALGLGVLVVLATYLVENRLAGRMEAQLPTAAPNLFLIDIQPAQWPGVKALLEGEKAEKMNSVPVVTARLAAIDGVASEKLLADARGERRWALTREQRLTYLERLPEDNQLVAGKLWQDPQHLEVSVEEEYARGLGVKLGSKLTFDVQGVPLELTVTSLRTVKWETFGINFYFVVEPAALADAPQQRVAAARLPEEREAAFQNELAAQFPNVTLLNLREILGKIAAVLRRISLGVRLLGGFTTLAGIAILASAVSASSARRGREVALLKTLGMTRFGVTAVFSVEYALVGLVAGLIGVASAGLLSWVVLTKRMEVPWEWSPWPFSLALLATAVMAVLAGLAASARPLQERPIEVLRGES